MRALPRGLSVVVHPPNSGGRDDTPKVVLAHGSLDRGASFTRVIRRLTDLEVVTYDRRGYHHSRDMAPLATSLDDHVGDLLAVVGDGPAVVIGHSYGGDVALGAAIEDPTTVWSVGAYEPPMPWTSWWPTRRRAGFSEDPDTFAESFFRRVAGDRAWDRLSEQARQDRRADGPALIAELLAIRGDVSPLDLARLSVPTVLGRGELSLPHHRQAVEELARVLPPAEIVEIAGATHGAHLTHPDAFAAFVRIAVQRAVEAPR